ncbi:hypothetical protein LJC47_07425 [Desulfosarcina sp. OttesenSCG-928-B08]|nr:hypothetical protein [Desulfosarcina sp. OttesenSCG-928-B08]
MKPLRSTLGENQQRREKRGLSLWLKKLGSVVSAPSRFKAAFVQGTDKCFGTRKLHVSENNVRSDASQRHAEPCPAITTYHCQGKAINPVTQLSETDK